MPVLPTPANLRTPISFFLRSLPDALHSEVFARLFNHLLQGQWMAEQLQDLDGKRLCLAITDTDTRLCFLIRGERFLRQPDRGSEQSWDVRIAGRLADFWLLASRSEDPDTLFFHRRLVLEGETETGLYIKNLLDALDFDWDAHLNAVLGPRLGQTARLLFHRLRLEQGFSRGMRLLQRA